MIYRTTTTDTEQPATLLTMVDFSWEFHPALPAAPLSGWSLTIADNTIGEDTSITGDPAVLLPTSQRIDIGSTPEGTRPLYASHTYTFTLTGPGVSQVKVATMPVSGSIDYHDLVDIGAPPVVTADAVPSTRTVATTLPLTGGGSLAANRTLGLSVPDLVSALATAGYYLVQNDATGPYIHTGA